MEGEKDMKIWTIGHSTRTLEELVELLKINQVNHLVDVRSFPRSRTNPQFNQNTLPKSLSKCDIQYTHLSALGGRRGVIKEMQPSPNTAWEVAAFRNYADYALTAAFKEGLLELLKIAKESRTVIMCSEAVWWRCHRRIITDYLLAQGVRVFHIMSETSTVEAEMTKFAKIKKNKNVTYSFTLELKPNRHSSKSLSRTVLR